MTDLTLADGSDFLDEIKKLHDEEDFDGMKRMADIMSKSQDEVGEKLVKLFIKKGKLSQEKWDTWKKKIEPGEICNFLLALHNGSEDLDEFSYILVTEECPLFQMREEFYKYFKTKKTFVMSGKELMEKNPEMVKKFKAHQRMKKRKKNLNSSFGG